MEEWTDVAALEQIEPGGYELLETDDVVVAVFNLDGELYAIEDVCTHDGEELTGGPIEGDRIICPRHGASFCIKTGAALTAPAYAPVTVYPVRVRDGMVQVRIAASG